MRLAALTLALALLALPVGAQDPGQAPPASPPAGAAVEQHAPTPATPTQAQAEQHQPAAGDHASGGMSTGEMIMHHITDSRAIEIPWPNSHLGRTIELPHWPPIHIGRFEIDLSPTKHVVMMFIAATLAAIVLILAANGQRRHTAVGTAPKGLPNGVEAVVLYMRNEIILPNVGHHGEKFVPFLLTLFFFILFANMLGLIPYLATATGNIAVTATLAIMSFLTVEIAGMRALGAGYLKTIVYWPHDMPVYMKLPLSLILTPVEIIGKFTKPFALTIRLFANMTAGHVVVLAFIGMIFTFGSYIIAVAPVLMAIAIMLLELLVAFLQAFIFTLLVSVFIGQIREGAH